MFDVALNNVIVIKDLDIFDKVGRGVAHDEIVAFQIKQNKIIINGKSLPFNNEIRVEFIKVRERLINSFFLSSIIVSFLDRS